MTNSTSANGFDERHSKPLPMQLATAITKTLLAGPRNVDERAISFTNTLIASFGQKTFVFIPGGQSIPRQAFVNIDRMPKEAFPIFNDNKQLAIFVRTVFEQFNRQRASAGLDRYLLLQDSGAIDAFLKDLNTTVEFLENQIAPKKPQVKEVQSQEGKIATAIFETILDGKYGHDEFAIVFAHTLAGNLARGNHVTILPGIRLSSQDLETIDKRPLSDFPETKSGDLFLPFVNSSLELFCRDIGEKSAYEGIEGLGDSDFIENFSALDFVTSLQEKLPELFPDDRSEVQAPTVND